MTSWLSHRERFDVVSSTNDVVRSWLAEGTPEVCLAVADAQTAGRGRDGRTWTAPSGGALLLSLGFRPTWLRPDQVWRLAAVVSIAMAEAGEEIASLPSETIALKWPNDLVVEAGDGVLKLAGVLGETDDIGHKAAVDKVSVRDFHATILHALGLDHERLIFPFQGLDQRLTGVEHARVVKEVFA